MAESRRLRAALRRLAALTETDPEVRAARVTAADVAFVRDGRAHAIELIAAVCERFATRPCLGERSTGRTLTFGELWSRVQRVAAALHDAHRVTAGDRVAIVGPPAIDWIVADLACLYLGATSVALQTTLSPADRADVLARTSPRCVLTIDDVEPLASQAAPARPFVAPSQPDALFSIVFTSGSTGGVKGVMLPEPRWTGTLRDALRTTPMPTITLGYLPLSHMAGRIALYTTLVGGGTTHFIANADMSTMFDDLRAVRPTSLTLVPRVSQLIHQRFKAECARRGNDAADAIMAEIRERDIGGRLCFATTGAAPTAPELREFLERCFDLHVVDTYGSTELGRVTVDGRVQPGVQYKLVDVPELGYTTADLPYPRGELAIKSARETPGYFGDAHATAQLRDADGYVLSGDIVEERAPGHIEWIDRKHGVLRLSNGEFVNVTRLEELFAARSRHIDQIFIHGSALRSYLLAVVVPTGDVPIDVVRAELARVAADAQLPAHEVPRDIVLERTPFTSDNGLLTETNKPRRPRLAAHYAHALDALHAAIEARQLQGLAAGGTAAETLRHAIAVTLGLDPAQVHDDASFTRLGGDSLNASRVTALLADHAGLTVPVALLLDPSATIATIVARVEARRSGRSAAAIHAGGTWAHAKDLTLPPFVPDDVLAAPRAAPSTVRTVLLTGANGFLGRFVLRALLTHDDVHVVCIVRGSDDDDARARLSASHGSALPDRVTVHAGDLAQPSLGLADVLWNRLAGDVDAIVHNGALVNHVLPYAEVFDANVGGTAEIIRLALTSRTKPVHFVSTTGVAAGVRGRVHESQRAADLWSRRPLAAAGFAYALGYTTSKWAAEVLLHDAHTRCGLPVTVTRCGMVLPHRTLDAFNAPDAFCRLVFGLARTGLAPVSFYADGPAAYDGLPVDTVAAFIAAIAVRVTSGWSQFHAAPARGGRVVSLDTIADALAVAVAHAGGTLTRLPYADWFDAFGRALASLTHEQRRTPYAILERWARPMTRRDALDLDTAQFHARLLEVTGAPAPELDDAYLSHCVRAICGVVPSDRGERA